MKVMYNAENNYMIIFHKKSTTLKIIKCKVLVVDDVYVWVEDEHGLFLMDENIFKKYVEIGWF
jgi:hypothetical protein